MRKWITFLMTLLVGAVSHVNAEYNAQLDFEAGYRCDTLRWTAKVPCDDPFLKTTTKFKDLDIFQIGLHGRTNLGCNLYLRGSASWGWILDGDYEDNVTIFSSTTGPFDAIDSIEFTTERDDVVDGNWVFDVSIAIGYPFYFCDCTASLAPVIGYSFDEQNVCVEENDRVLFAPVDGIFVPVITDDCCCEKLVSRWHGPFIGLDFNYRPYNECWSVFAELEWHYGRYRVKRHGGIDFSPFADFDRSSRHAHGWVFAVGADYDFGCNWTVGIDFKWQDWSAKLHRHDCEDETTFLGTSLGEIRSRAHWRSYAVNLTVGHEF